MKRFIVSVLCVAVFFIGLGSLIENVGAKFKSDARALELLGLARQAVGGEQSIANVRSLTAAGRTTKIFHIEGEQPKTEQGDWELNMQLPDKFSRKMMLRHEGGKGEAVQNEVFVIRQHGGDAQERVALPLPGSAEAGSDKKRVAVMVKKEGGEERVVTGNGGEGANGEPKRVFVNRMAGGFHQNELFRTALALLLTPPQGVDVTYKYAGEGDVDGTSCDIIEATANGASIRLYLGKSTHLPAMMTYQAPKPFSIRIRKEEGRTTNVNEEVNFLRERMPAGAHELAEFQVKFSDYRSVGGVQLPHRWTQTVGGKEDETIEITGYELNPANIADKFKAEPARTFVRTAKPQQ